MRSFFVAAGWDAPVTNHGRIVLLGAVAGLLQLQPTAAPPHAQEVQEQEIATPSRPLFEQYASGLLVRKTYRPDVPGPLALEIWDLRVGPGKKSEPLSLPGAAVLEVRFGEGLIFIDGRVQETRMGASLAIPEGAQFWVDNGRSERAFAARAILISRP